MAPRQTYNMPASYTNTMLALSYHAPGVQQAQALYEAAAQQVRSGPQQAVTAPVQQQQQQHVRISNITFTGPTTSSLPAIWRRSSIEISSRRRSYHWSDTTMSSTEYFSAEQYFGRGTDAVGIPLDYRQDDAAEEEAPVAEYATGHVDQYGYPLKRLPTPYPEGTSPTADRRRDWNGRRFGVKKWWRGFKKTMCLS